MAFTTEEETRIRTMLSAYEGGLEIAELELSVATAQDKEIEVFDTKSGASGRMPLRDAVRIAGSPSCGRYWDESNATPQAAGWFGSLEMLRQLPELLGLGCYLVQNDHSRRKLDPTNHYRFATGETAKLDGSMGHYQWGWGKKFYLAIYRVGTLCYEEISLAPIPGQYNYEIPVASMSAHGFASMDRTTSTLVSYVNDDAQYRGGGNNDDWDGTYRTLLGKPATNLNIEAFRAAARKNGSGWLAGSMRHLAVVRILFEIIFGTRNVQAAYNASKDKDGLYQGGLGSGVTTVNSTEWNNYNSYYPFLPTTVGIELGDSCGVSEYEVPGVEEGDPFYTAQVPVFFGLKNPFGYLWRLMDDEFVRINSDKTATHLVAPSLYGTWTVGNETGMKAYSTSPGQGESYIKKLSDEHLENFCTATGGSSTTYYCDYFWNTSGAISGFRVCLRGGGAYSGARCGLSTLFVYNAVSSAYAYWGSPLCEAESDWSVDAVYAEP